MLTVNNNFWSSNHGIHHPSIIRSVSLHFGYKWPLQVHLEPSVKLVMCVVSVNPLNSVVYCSTEWYDGPLQLQQEVIVLWWG